MNVGPLHVGCSGGAKKSDYEMYFRSVLEQMYQYDHCHTSADTAGTTGYFDWLQRGDWSTDSAMTSTSWDYAVLNVWSTFASRFLKFAGKVPSRLEVLEMLYPAFSLRDLPTLPGG
jgi:hypothetical protein